MAPNPTGSIEQVLASDARFSTLAKAVDLAQLNATLAANGPYTIFAPTNDAFAALPAGELDKLLANPAQLGQVLSYHVVSGSIPSADLATRTSLPTLDGKPIQVTTSGNEIMLNGSTRLLSTEIATNNGVIHVIDKVLIPSN
jgi:transforming growth factor-beta-induced protein